MSRLLIVGRVDPGAERELIDIFTEADRSELSGVTGVRHRSLYRLHDLFLHLIETAGPIGPERGAQHPIFVRTTERLAAHVGPYLPEQRSPRDAMATCFYHWDAPTSR